MEVEELYKFFKKYPSVQTDTRKLKEGDIFFALKGDNFNGNKFAMQALEAGAVYALIDEDINSDDTRLIKTDNVLETLQQLAKYHREQFKIPFIGITGSNGKTTTKELVHAVLSSQYKTYTTEGNLNNHIGIPLTILKVKDDAEIAVIEMGANHQKEIEGYCEYAQPTHGIITNCGKAHLEGFGGEAGVRKGKGELFDFIKLNDGVVFAYDDYKYLHSMSHGIKNIVWYGTKNGIICGHASASEPFLEIEITKGLSFQNIQTQLVGDYNLPNVLCALAIGKYFTVPDEKIKAAIENYSPSNSRSQMLQMGTNKIILDAYNANPTSMKAAIENLSKIQATNKILMLGGMMELGDESLQEHEDILRIIKKYQWNEVVLVGGDFEKTNDSFQFFKTSAEAALWFKKMDFQNAYILIKGSRSMQMEKVIAKT